MARIIHFEQTGKKPIGTQIGTNVFEGIILQKLPNLGARLKEIGFQYVYYQIGSGEGIGVNVPMNDKDAATVNTFLGGLPVGVYIPIQDPNFLTIQAWVKKSFPTLAFYVDDIETLNITKGQGQGMTNETYITRAKASYDFDPSKPHIVDGGQMQREDIPVQRERNEELAKEVWVKIVRQYEQLGDLVAITTDSAQNIINLNNCFDVILPDLRQKFVDRFGTDRTEGIVQFFNADAGRQQLSPALDNWSTARHVMGTLANTERYKYFTQMQFGNLFNRDTTPTPEFDTLKRLIKCFKFKHTMPVTMDVAGHRAQGFVSDTNFGLLITNDSLSKTTYSKEDIKIGGKVITSSFTNDFGWASSLVAPVRNETVTLPTFDINPLSASFITFTAIGK